MTSVRRAEANFFRETPPLYGSASATEASYYPLLRDLWSEELERRRLPFEVRTATSERRSGGGTDLPDLALYDRGDFPVVLAEVKRPEVRLRDIAFSTEQKDQVGRYLAQTGVVLVTNVRAIGLLACKPGFARNPTQPVPPDQRDLLEEVELWSSEEALARGASVPRESFDRLGDLLERAVTEFAPIADPASLARILARQARRAKADLPARFDAVAPLLEDYSKALGLSFEDEEGADFFRSSLIQTAYYGIFAGWTLWHRANDGEPFEWERMDRYLKIPFLGQLFYEFRHPTRLAELRLAPHLDRASETLGRVERSIFFSRFAYRTVQEKQDPSVEMALTYFYEPFLESFDPELRKELGVWFTPPEIVRYQVERVDQLLRDELGCARGFADERVVVLDPCCGTGAYLLEVVRCIARDIRARGEEALLGQRLLEALLKRVIGFEILTAPFVISQLQLYLLLSDIGSEAPAGKRPAVFLTNALCGWDGPEQVKLNFPELKEEHDAASRVKRDAKIIVILGNPPYNRFAGTALDEEADLVDHYKGITRRVKKNNRGEVVTGKDDKPVMIQQGDSALYTRFGISKQLLDDLYIRFYRLAEKRIGEKADYGVVSLISNSSFLTGRSHPLMRESLLTNFHEIWIDNMHGNRLASERTPWGESCETLFSTDTGSGIKVGTCVVTVLKRRTKRTAPDATPIHHRDFWGRAEAKRLALLESLEMEAWNTKQRKEASVRPEGPRPYETFTSSEAKRWRFSPQEVNAGYEAWPALDELFPVRFQGVNPARGLEGSVVDTDRTALETRMRFYFSAQRFEDVRREMPELARERASYEPEKVWEELRRSVEFDSNKLREYQLFPLDSRWIYYETESKLLIRRSPDFWDHLPSNEFLLGVPQARRVSETRALFSTTLADWHLHDRGSFAYPRETHAGKLVSTRLANLQPRAWKKLQAAYRLKGERTDEDAKALVGRLFRLALTVLHSPSFEEHHREALTHDWAHVPIPRSLEVLDEIAVLGDQLVILLDPQRDADAVIESILGAERMRTLGVPRSASGKQSLDLTLRISYFGAAKGRWSERDYRPDEADVPAWGERTGDLWINDDTRFENVPERVFRHELGGYPVIRKWLGYRAADRRGGKSLTLEEVSHLRSIVQRLAAILALGPSLDSSHEKASANAFDAEELGLRAGPP